MAKITSIVADEIYPVVAQSLDKNSNKFKMAIASFFNAKHKDIHDIAPYVIIYYNKSDRDNMFKSLGLSEEYIDGLLKKTFFYDIPFVFIGAGTYVSDGLVYIATILSIYSGISYYNAYKDFIFKEM